MIDYEISVIIPIYMIKTETLDRAVGSLLENSGIELEILLICNGSEEKLKKYCREKYQEEEKIKIYELDEANVSRARNLGIQNASGKYIGFVDADDYVEPDMFSILYKDASEEGADLVLCDYFREQGNLIQKEQLIERLEDGIQISNTEIIDNLIGDGNKSMMGSVWRSLCRRDFLLSNGVEFNPSLSIGEDFLFILELLIKGAILYIEHRALYHYLINRNSASLSINDKKWNEYARFLEKLIEFTDSNLNLEKYSYQIYGRIRNTSVWITESYIRSSVNIQKKVQFVSNVSRTKQQLERKVVPLYKESSKVSDGVLLFFLDRKWSVAAVLYGQVKRVLKR